MFIHSNRDIYLLDDPFSAVDVAEFLFQNVVKNALLGKTVILVSHEPKVCTKIDTKSIQIFFCVHVCVVSWVWIVHKN